MFDPTPFTGLDLVPFGVLLVVFLWTLYAVHRAGEPVEPEPYTDFDWPLADDLAVTRSVRERYDRLPYSGKCIGGAYKS